jgi:hypothetical protein
MIGDNAFGQPIALPVELRDGGVLDFGREHALAWYGIWGFRHHHGFGSRPHPDQLERRRRRHRATDGGGFAPFFHSEQEMSNGQHTAHPTH